MKSALFLFILKLSTWGDVTFDCLDITTRVAFVHHTASFTERANLFHLYGISKEGKEAHLLIFQDNKKITRVGYIKDKLGKIQDTCTVYRGYKWPVVGVIGRDQQ